jgi:ABC-type branched-subunit amino acid transport system substrate-binding protein
VAKISSVNHFATGSTGPSKSRRRGRRSPFVALLVALSATLLVVGCSSSKSSSKSSSSAGSSSASAAPGSDIGLTATEIRIGVIADIATPVFPGLFQKNVDAVQAWAKTVNAKGGLAGRQIAVDVYDSKLDPNATKNALIAACTKDFALVGTAALAIGSVTDITQCADSTGKATGIPDLAGIAFSQLEQCAPTTFNATGTDETYCQTLTEHPQTFTVNVGDARYFTSTFPDLHGVFIINTDTPASRISETPTYTAMSNVGIKKDGNGFYTASGSAPQSAQTPIVLAMKAAGSTFEMNGSTPGNMAQLRQEAQLQGLTTVKVWECNSGCYSPAYLTQAGSAAESTYASLLNIPFYTEYKDNPTLATEVAQLGGVDKIDNNALASFDAALLFQDAIGKATANGGTLNRATLFTALKNEHSFNAQGIIGTTDVGNHQASPCIVIVEVKNGAWQRVFPTKAGTFDCTPANLATVKLDMTK